MPIVFHCPCGRRLRVRDENAGRRIRCPDCGEALRVPEAEEEVPPVECWKCSSLNENLLILTPGAFISVKIDNAKRDVDEVIGALFAGSRPEDVLDGSQTVIPLDALWAVEIDRNDTWLTLRYKWGSRNAHSPGMSSGSRA